jgi:hypothetical protein
MAERTLKEGGEKVQWSVKDSESTTLKSKIEGQRRALRDFGNYYAENKGKMKV